MIRDDQINDAAKRAAYIDGLRKLADLLDSTPSLPLPNTDGVNWYLFQNDWVDNEAAATEDGLASQKSEAARIVRLLPGAQEKQDTSGLFRFKGYIGGLTTEVIVNRPAVCERVVTGVETVTRHVPDPAVEVPLVEVTEEVETFEWRCEPLLAAKSGAES